MPKHPVFNIFVGYEETKVHGTFDGLIRLISCGLVTVIVVLENYFLIEVTVADNNLLDSG